MIIKLPQFSCSLTALFLVSTEDFEPIEWLLKSLVGKIIEVVFFAAWTILMFIFDLLNTLSTEALSTACHLIRLTKDLQANRTVSLKIVWRIFHKFTLKSSLVL